MSITERWALADRLMATVAMYEACLTAHELRGAARALRQQADILETIDRLDDLATASAEEVAGTPQTTVGDTPAVSEQRCNNGVAPSSARRLPLLLDEVEALPPSDPYERGRTITIIKQGDLKPLPEEEQR